MTLIEFLLLFMGVLAIIAIAVVFHLANSVLAGRPATGSGNADRAQARRG